MIVYNLNSGSDHVILYMVVNLTQSFALEEKSGKKCYMIGARGLSIAGEEDKLGYWQWTTVPASRYSSINYQGYTSFYLVLIGLLILQIEMHMCESCAQVL